MKKQLLVLSLIALCFAGISLTSCSKKDKDTDNFESEASVQSDDQSQVSAQIDDVSSEIDEALETTGLAGKGADIQSICGVSADTSSANGVRTLTLTYNGPDCLNRFTRTGVVTVSIPAGVQWKNAGATITVQYQNMVFTSLSTNRSIAINGSHTITNVSGHLLYELANLGSPIIHDINSSGMSITFASGNQRTWQVARRRTFTYDNGVVLSITGTHTENGINNISEWGTNRNGRAFVSAVTEPVVIRQDCNFRVTSGKITHTLPAFTAAATFGLNSAGSPTSCPGAGSSYYVKIDWAVAGGATHSHLYPY